MSTATPAPPAAADKVPRTERGRQTLRKLLNAAEIEFGEKGFHEASINGITTRAGTALGSFYTYFDSKEAIFRALVGDLSARVREAARQRQEEPRPALEQERVALTGFLRFAATHKEIYQIIDEAKFVDPESYREHYRSTARRILDRLEAGIARGELREDLEEAHAWAIMGMNVFLGMRYAVWDDEDPDRVAAVAADILGRGIAKA
ncbi:TetR/AcrR family transcriptional regulator [Novosphingobium olei]|uniref:TetR/AcrR family transcriptional regulator n=1 Tax=Novosphingobium olei TaxID=2728851 RepID=UPI00308FBE0B|nr:TetR/AcrR family transcriptional regulator [Novosphingobium olei]